MLICLVTLSQQSAFIILGAYLHSVFSNLIISYSKYAGRPSAEVIFLLLAFKICDRLNRLHVEIKASA